jgi:ABC-type cobalamin/Fe3+-siderophores transport system ATPase subunit
MKPTPLLEIHNLTVSYGERIVLDGISLSLANGSVLVVIGPNGAGKTTLIRAISGVIPAHPGQIVLEGRSLAGLNHAERAQLFAVVPQARNLPPGVRPVVRRKRVGLLPPFQEPDDPAVRSVRDDPGEDRDVVVPAGRQEDHAPAGFQDLVQFFHGYPVFFYVI